MGVGGSLLSLGLPFNCPPLQATRPQLSQLGAADPAHSPLSYRIKCLSECYIKLKVNFSTQHISMLLLVFY